VMLQRLVERADAVGLSSLSLEGNKQLIAGETAKVLIEALAGTSNISECNVRGAGLDEESARRLAKLGGERPILLAGGGKDGETDVDAILIASDMAIGGIGSCAEAKSAGYSARVVKAAGYMLHEIKAGGYSLQEIKAGGFTCQEAREGGYSLQEIRAGGYVEGIKAAGFTCQEAREGGYSLQEAREGGYSLQEIKAGGYTCQELKDAGYTCKEAKEGGYSPHEAQQAYSAEEIAEEGRLLSELATCRAHSNCVSSVVFSPDGKTIVSGSRDKTIKVWDAGTLARHIPHPSQN
jgi:ribosomal protein L13E